MDVIVAERIKAGETHVSFPAIVPSVTFLFILFQSEQPSLRLF